jgi:NAD(P)-dependent dehydrogenase (short-subunit alcohol dehydrogenase family)
MPTIDRRSMLAGSVALAAVAAVPAAGQSPNSKLLAGKAILITGTSSGFGRLGALLYARQGAKVFATMRGLPRPEADELKKIAADEKLDLTVMPLDVLSDEQVASTIAAAEKQAGGALDILVNNAGVVIGGPIELQDIEAMRLAFDTNVFGYQRTARAVLPAMRKRKSGLIVNVSSQQGRVIMPGMGVYAPTKFAVEALSEQMAYEVAPHGIEVLIIQPGGFPTNVGANRARYTKQVADRAEPIHAAGYPEMMASMSRTPPPSSGQASALSGIDPNDVPRAIAEIAAMPAGQRPLRRPVHPGNKPQLEINRVSRETQLTLLGGGPYAEWARAVLDG